MNLIGKKGGAIQVFSNQPCMANFIKVCEVFAYLRLDAVQV